MKRIVILFSLFPMLVWAAPPVWNVVLLQYEQRMSFTAVVSIDEKYSVSKDDIVGVYLGTELRGVGTITFIDSASGRGIFLFQMGLRTSDEGYATFRLYDSKSDQVVEAKTTVLIESNAIKGTISSPFVISNTDLFPEGELNYNNYISPNNDNLNDVLKIENVDAYQGFRLTIFEEEGTIFYQSGNYNNDWGGIYNGSMLPTGVYYFVFQNELLNKRFLGTFSIKQR